MCREAHEDYTGDDHCSYNIARALLDAKQILTAGVSTDPTEWAWGNIHYKKYKHDVWSNTPFA